MFLRILVLTGWLLIPVAGLACHMGPGQERKALDAVAQHLTLAEAAAGEHDYLAAIDEYNDALKARPEGRTAEGRKIRLEKAKAQMLARQLPEAHADLKVLVDDLAGDPKLLADARSTLANSQYCATWLMRLEGLGRDEWELEIEAARQTYKLLTENAEGRGDTAAAKTSRPPSGSPGSTRLSSRG